MKRAALVLLALLLAGCAAAPAAPPVPGTTLPAPTGELKLAPFASGLHSPVALVPVPDDSGRLVVAQQDGLVKLLPDGPVLLDASALTREAGERGFLGFAFHPEYATNGVFVASYTDLEGDSILARYRKDGSSEVLLKVDQPFANHNGGHVAFGPDGKLYYGLGDGGSAGDPHGNGQDKDALLASMLRIDVGASGPARVPTDNPFGSFVWAKGLRNPWRFSFDRASGDLWIGDVGQNQYEEIDYQPASSRGGENYGWNAFEGTHRYSPSTVPFSATTAPVAEYGHDDGCSVTGGFVLRGPSVPTHAGVYVFGDYCSGKIWTLRPEAGAWKMDLALDTDLSIVSFGEDEAGDVYVLDHRGSILKLVEG